MIDVKETLSAAEERMEMAAMYLAEELSHIRAGRANVAILDGVRVNSYGTSQQERPYHIKYIVYRLLYIHSKCKGNIFIRNIVRFYVKS